MREPVIVATQEAQLRVNLCMCRQLKAGDSNEPAGGPDEKLLPSPFVEVSCAGQVACSRTIPKTTEPLFMQTVVLDIDLVKPKTGADGGGGGRVSPEPVMISVFDALDQKGAEAGLRGETRRSAIRGKMGLNFDIAVTGQMGINLQLVDVMYACSEV